MKTLSQQIIAWLRASGEEVFSIRESFVGASDTEVLAIAEKKTSLLLKPKVPGIVLLRLGTRPSAEVIQILALHWMAIIEHCRDHLVIVHSDRIRARLLNRNE